MNKVESIKSTLKATRERRKTQTCKVYTCKIDHSHLTVRKQEYLNRLFLEAKWLRNHFVGLENVFEADYRCSRVFVLNKDKEHESREIRTLSSQMKQGILDQVKNDISGLAASKEKGRKVGKLKFKGRVDSINLKQFDVTYKVRKNHIVLQGFKGQFRIRGIKQIPDSAEFANAKLIRKPSGYYLAITCYLPKEVLPRTNKQIGFDFGIETHITNSDGKKDKWSFTETKRHKKIQRKVNKTYKPEKKSSKNREYRKHLCRLEHEKLFNRKKDAINKFISAVNKDYDFVAVQDENIAEWKSSRMKGWGRIVHRSIMGGIISGIKKLPQTTVVDRWEPTTQECRICGSKTKHTLDKRLFVCSNCGHTEDRDIHSAKVVLKKAITICMERTNITPVEDFASTGLSATAGQQAKPMKQEAHGFSRR